jgi:RNase P subunit RPR2
MDRRMSNTAWVRVAEYGEKVHVLCATCGTHDRYALIKDAQEAARIHNRTHHSAGIDWAS